MQEKLVLTRMPDGRWGRPVEGAPSTHIPKPKIAGYESTVENEAFCMRVAAHLGLAAAAVETIEVDGRSVLVVERYDRDVATNGTVRRVHQEDFCQALGIPPDRKYQAHGGPSLARIAQMLQEAASNDAPEIFLRALTLNVALGNCDAHAKNFSLLHTDSGALRMAPLYDLVSTRFYPDIEDKLAMYVDGVQKADRVTSERIVNEAVRWSMRRELAEEVVGDIVGRLGAAVETAATEISGVPEALLRLVGERVEAMGAS